MTYLDNIDVLDGVPKDDVSPKANLNLDGEELERALGVQWNVIADSFTFNFTPLEAPATKRGILKIASSLFDPLGFLTPFTLKAKLLLQELWRKKYEWDDEIDENMAACWEKWKIGVKKANCVQIPRCYNANGHPIFDIQLHIFLRRF